MRKIIKDNPRIFIRKIKTHQKLILKYLQILLLLYVVFSISELRSDIDNLLYEINSIRSNVSSVQEQCEKTERICDVLRFR